jgi:hypothetical protein
VAAPRWRAHEEGDLLGRVVGRVGLLAPLDAGMGLDELAVEEDLDDPVALAGVHLVADVAPWHRVEGLSHFHMFSELEEPGLVTTLPLF